MKSSEYTEEFPRKFRGNTKLGFLGISSEYTDGIPRKHQSVGIFRENSDELVIDRCVFGHKSIDRSIYKKTFEILKPQTLVPRYFLEIFSFYRTNISRKLKLEFRRNSDGYYPSDPRFYNHEPLLLPHFSLLPLRDSSLFFRRFPPEIRRYLRRSPPFLTQIM